MQVKGNAECIKLPFVINNFVLSIFEWPLKTGFTVQGVVSLPRLVQSLSLIPDRLHI